MVVACRSDIVTPISSEDREFAKMNRTYPRKSGPCDTVVERTTGTTAGLRVAAALDHTPKNHFSNYYLLSRFRFDSLTVLRTDSQNTIQERLLFRFFLGQATAEKKSDQSSKTRAQPTRRQSRFLGSSQARRFFTDSGVCT